jgi:hypothetical protein
MTTIVSCASTWEPVRGLGGQAPRRKETMFQRQDQTEYPHEEYASEMAIYRPPQTSALVAGKIKITLDTGTTFDLEFIERNKVVWQCGAERGTDWCEAVEVAPNTFFIDMTFTSRPRQSQTFIVSTETRQALGIRTVIREGDIGQKPRAVHVLTAGQIGDPAIPPTGRKPGPTRDLFGLRAIYAYNPGLIFEHAYLNTDRYCWHCLAGPLKGHADVEMCSIYKWDDNQYIFCWREFGLAVSAVFFYDWYQMRSTGKLFAIGNDGTIANRPAGALINKISMAFYPLDAQPL